MTTSSSSSFAKLALTALALTFALMTLGGVVHNTGSSLACPDWPLCYGQVFPKMEGGVAIEHSHRLLAALVGFLTLGLMVISGRDRQRDPALFKGSLLAVALVVFQGVLGGVTVIMQLSPIVSTAHLATSQAFLATLLWLNVRSRKNPRAPGAAAPVPSKVFVGLGLAIGGLFFQMLLGAAIRHGGAGVACGLGREAMVMCVDPLTSLRTWWPSVVPAQLNMLHRIGGLVAGVAIIGGTIPALKWARSQGPAAGLRPVRLFCVAAHALWLVQVYLGMSALKTYLGVTAVTLHLVVAALMWLALWSALFLTQARTGTRPTQ